MKKEEFIDRFGDVYEHSPWIAAKAHRDDLDAGNVDEVATAMADCVEEAGEVRQLALLQAHPDLAGRAAVAGEMTEASTGEQTSAGIDQCTPEEFERFQALNARYRDKFGFPFIMAVRGSNRHTILDAFEERVKNDHDTAFRRALDEVHKIARFRLEALVESP